MSRHKYLPHFAIPVINTVLLSKPYIQIGHYYCSLKIKISNYCYIHDIFLNPSWLWIIDFRVTQKCWIFLSLGSLYWNLQSGWSSSHGVSSKSISDRFFKFMWTKYVVYLKRILFTFKSWEKTMGNYSSKHWIGNL